MLWLAVRALRLYLHDLYYWLNIIKIKCMEDSCKIKNRPKNINELIKSRYFWIYFLGITLGIAGGFMFYYFIGCPSGTCAITSNPYLSMIWGGIIGFFISRIISFK